MTEISSYVLTYNHMSMQHKELNLRPFEFLAAYNCIFWSLEIKTGGPSTVKNATMISHDADVCRKELKWSNF